MHRLKPHSTLVHIIIIIIHSSYKVRISKRLDQGAVHLLPLLIRCINHS